MTVIYIYSVNCMKFGQLIPRKVIQIVATRCHILRLNMHQIRFRLGLRPRPRWGSLQRSPDPLAELKGSLLLRGREVRKEKRRGREREREREKGRRRKGGEGGKRKRREWTPPRIL